MEEDFCCGHFKYFFDRGCIYRGDAHLLSVAVITEKNENGHFWLLSMYSGLDEVEDIIDYCPFCGTKLKEFLTKE